MQVAWMHASFRRSLVISGCSLLVSSVSLTGCGMVGTSASSPTRGGNGYSLSGSVHGGQQPVAGATIALYAAGKTGPGSTPRSMLPGPIPTDPGGGFNLSGLYTCQPGDQVYLVATGGNAGGGVNGSIALMTALGPCSTLLANAATTFISVNEVTTVASVFALAPFMNGVQSLGADYGLPASSNALAAAFATTQTLVNTSNGFAPQTSQGQGVVPLTTINSLANSLAACVNTGTTGGASNSCTSLFMDTTVAGNTPADTLQAALNMAHNPSSNAAAIFALAAAAPPFQPTLKAAPANYAIAVAHPSDVLTYHNDNTRAGVQADETVLTPASVSSASFGKKFTLEMDASPFAQPLYVGGLGMPDGAVHNLVYGSTTHGTIYAFDADGNNPAVGYLWRQSYVPVGERFAAAADYGGCNNPPEAGILGTPVIDRASQTMYFVTKTVAATGTITAANTYQRIHAVSLIDGSERAGSPTLINPTFAGAGDGSTGGAIAFNPQRQSNRSALTLTGSPGGAKTVWVNYASHCDIGPYHGDVLGFNAANVAQLTATFNNTPNGSEGGIWMSNGGMAADAQGYLYALAGNGSFTAATGGADYGDAATKLQAPAGGSASTAMTVADYFAPSNQAYLQSRDLDLGGAEGILFSDSGSGMQLLVGSDKNGYIYLLNTANMGRYRTGTHGVDGLNGDVQDFGGQGTVIHDFALFNNVLYTSTPLKAFTFQPGSVGAPGTFNPTASATTNFSYTAPVVSANGTSNGLVWTQEQSGTLHAFAAPSLTEVYNSQTAGSRDTPAGYVKFTSPVIANGKVYLSGNNAIVVYGMLP